jgi:hypothetical protein
MSEKPVTADDLIRKIVEILHLMPGKDVIEIAIDRSDENRLMIIRHAATNAVRE